eukprot:CAMPEP_0180144760 /NCGR_PEP_ID=MMETSP0986-20121125/17171_1 /TAXON_ID=697907 /ORGANISM="non described non described, Strain CCMP2293" /LENGTH=31 /DNA_ID= /DNA_START= /DNA_END= /DNA_ORIENTATION=
MTGAAGAAVCVPPPATNTEMARARLVLPARA